MSAKLLIVEDDVILQKALCDFLQSEGFMTDCASTGATALQKIEQSEPSLVLLDLGLPDIQGESILLKVRKDHPKLPVVILTAKSKPQEIAHGLNLGADDYLAKPFAVEELLARINARIPKEDKIKDKLEISDLSLDLTKMVAKRGDKEINLTKTEFELLKFLLENIGTVVSRDIILNHVWKYSFNIESRVVDVYMGYLRRKIDHGHEKELIKNKRGFGYFIDAN